MNKGDKQYQDLYQLYVRAHPKLTHSRCQSEVVELWKNVIKVKKGGQIDQDKYEVEFDKLKTKISQTKSSDIKAFFKFPTKKKLKDFNSNVGDTSVGSSTSSASAETVPTDVTKDSDPPIIIEHAEPTENKAPVEAMETNEENKDVETPVQDALNKEIDGKEKLLAHLYEARNLDFGGDSLVSIASRIKTTKSERDVLKRKLKLRIQKTKANRKYRKKKKDIEEKIKVNYPDLARDMNLRETVGRPRLEVDQPGILEDLLRIATIGSACSDKRRDDLFRTVKTTDDLQKAITDLGYKVSRSAVYVRLLPRDQTTKEGKRHVKTIPVKLVKPDNNLRTKHKDRMFAAETSRTADTIAATMGPEACTHVSQDDKSSVHIGVTAAKKQQSLLMNMSVRVRLPDHDFNVGSRHLLVPSVMAACVIDPKSGVTYTGPTYVAIRSSKHNNSSAHSHHEDLKRFIEVDPELFMVKGSDHVVKPVLIKSLDGGPDENPRFLNNTHMACKTFQDLKLDLLMELTQAPGLSAYNRAERRMYHLSRALTGVVLPVDTYGTHLRNGKTIDTELEVRNFEAAGEVLGKLFEELVIDDYKVTAEYISKPPQEETKTFKATPEFRAAHMFESQYMTSYMKCEDRSCCSAPITSVLSFFPHRRIPALIPITFSPAGPVALKLEPDVFKKDLCFLDPFARIAMEQVLAPTELKVKYGEKIPYDVYFPTQQSKVERRVCKVCKKYFSTLVSLNIHKKVCKQKRAVSKNKRVKKVQVIDSSDESSDEDYPEDESVGEVLDSDEEESDLEIVQLAPTISVPGEGHIETILNLKEFLKLPWRAVIE